MKKNILLLFVFILFTGGLNAQIYQPLVINNANWTVVSIPNTPDNYGNFPEFNQYSYFTGFDTLIDSKNCITIHQNDYISDTTTVTNEGNRIGFLFEDSYKRIQFLTVNHCSGAISRMLLYDFSKNIGDTIVFTTDSANLIYAYKSLIISGIDSIYIFDKYRKQFHFEGNAETWIEGIGSIHGLLHPISGNESCDCSPSLVCYKIQNTTNYLNPIFTNCYPVSSASVPQIQNSNTSIKIFPNPVKEKSSIHIKQSISQRCIYKIFNDSGTLVKSGLISDKETEIAIHNFPQGIYFVLVTDGQTKISSVFAIQ